MTCGKTFSKSMGYGSNWEEVCGSAAKMGGGIFICQNCQQAEKEAFYKEAVEALMRMYGCSYGAAEVILKRGA